MIEKQYKTRRGAFSSIYPECQLIQYILPSFVASYVAVHNDPNVGQDKKKEFLQFVHMLVDSYETKEYCQEVVASKNQRPKLPFMYVALGCLTVNLIKISSCQREVKRYFEKLLSGSKVLDTLFNKDISTIFSQRNVDSRFLMAWITQMNMFYTRLDKVVASFEKGRPTTSGMIIFIAFLQSGSPKVDMNESVVQYCRFALDKFMQRQTTARVPCYMIQDLNSLSVNEIFGLALFWFVRNFKADKNDLIVHSQGPGFSLDAFEAAMWALYTGDVWTLKQQMSAMAFVSGGEDMTLLNLDEARLNSCYMMTLALVTNERKVEMRKQGEITFFPVKHCRWCGLLEAPQMKKCKMCFDNPDYADVNYFCSEKCEQEALDKQHTEEHARSLMIRCGISN